MENKKMLNKKSGGNKISGNNQTGERQVKSGRVENKRMVNKRAESSYVGNSGVKKSRPENSCTENKRMENSHVGNVGVKKSRPENSRVKNKHAENGHAKDKHVVKKHAEEKRPDKREARGFTEFDKTVVGAAVRKSGGTKSPCPVSKKCGGCRWIHKPYEEQLKQKEKWVKELLQPYCSTEPIIGMEEPSHYRNKVHAVFGEDKKHNPVSGIYEEGTHYIVPVDSCLIENKKADEIIVSIRNLLKSFKIRPYNEDTGYGLLRHVLIRTGQVTGEIMVVLVLSSPVMPSKNNFIKALLRLHPEITTIVVNVNNRATTMVLGDKEQVIYGKGYIEDILCGMTFRISPKSFYQVNPVQAEKLYRQVIEYAGLIGNETVLDAYCGTGTIGLIASAQAGKVIGVELNADAVRDARNNAKRNGVTNIQFYQNDAGKFLLEMAEQHVKVDVLLMDPPRSGSDGEFLAAVAKIRPEKIVYISCNPETMVRDLKVLKKSGYGVRRGGAVDMFPFTDHVECVVLMSRVEK